MIKNCINTFFSSVFRVLGRICAYLIVGIVFYILASYLGLLRVNAATISYSSSRWAFGYHTFSSSSDNYYDFTWEALLPIPNPTDRFFVPPKNAGVSSYLSFPITAFRFDIVDVNLKPDTWYEITVNFGFSNNYTGIFWENATVNSCYVSNVACSNASVRKINNSQIKFTFKPASSGDYLYIDVGKTTDGKNIPELLTNFAEPSLAEYQYFYVSSLTIEPISDVSGELSDLNNKQQQTNNKLDQAEETRQGIWETIKALPGKFLDMLKGLFIPDNFDFLDDFKETLETKLGFIAEVPIALIDFILGLVTADWSEFNSLSFPSIEVFGVNFWGTQEISLQEAIDIFSPYKYVTDVICVVICVNTLKRWYDNFAGGGNS